VVRAKRQLGSVPDGRELAWQTSSGGIEKRINLGGGKERASTGSINCEGRDVSCGDRWSGRQRRTGT